MATYYTRKDRMGHKVKPGYVQVIGYECYINGICDEIDKSSWSVMGFASRAFIRVKAKHHIKRLKGIFPDITDDKVALGLAIELPVYWEGPCSKYGWSPKTSKFWNEFTRSLSDDWRPVLGLDHVMITYEEAKRAFRIRIQETHPDHGGSPKECQKVLDAWKFAKTYFGK